MDFETLLSHSPNPYIVVDRDLTIAWMNDAYLRATMRERTDLVGRYLFDAFPSEESSGSYKLLRSSLDRVLHTGSLDEIAHIRYDIARPDGVMEQRYWSATHTPQLGSDGEVGFILQHTVDVTELHGLRKLRDEAGLVGRAKAVQARYFDLAREAEWLKEVFDQAPGFIAILDGRDHRFIVANQAFREMFGIANPVGQRLSEVLPADAATPFAGQIDEVLRTRLPYIGENIPFDLHADPQAADAQRRVDVICQPILAPDGTSSGVFVQGHDVSLQARARERQRELIEELNHRVKNNLAVIQGIARQTFRSLPGAGKASTAFVGRLHAMAAAHEILASQDWEPVALGRLAERVIARSSARDEISRIALDGPDVFIPAQMTGSLALILNELASNAVLHGALGREGRVALTWSPDTAGGASRLLFEWLEIGCRHADTPVGPAGVGTMLLRNLLPSGAEPPELDFRPDGFRYRAAFLIG